MSERRALPAALALIAIAAIWGGTFVMVKDAVARYPLYAFLGLRFSIAVAAFVAIFPRSVGRLDKGTLRVGLGAGALLCVGYVFQTWGLQGTTASKAAFITGMFVVITPVLQAAVLRSIPRAWTLVGVVLAVSGLWLLTGASANGWTVGDSRVLVCAVAYASHMIVLGGPGRRHDPLSLTFVQLVVVAVVCSAISVASESAGLPPDFGVWAALLVTGVLASAVAFGVQTWAQHHISPTKTALILIMEPAFGAVFGWAYGDPFGTLALLGSALILGGMVVSEALGAVPTAEEEVIVPPSPEGLPVPLLEPAEESTSGSGDAGPAVAEEASGTRSDLA